MKPLLEKFQRDKLISPPRWLVNNIAFLVQMGSVAYGVSNDNSDIDVYGFVMPPVDILFPHTDGKILGFDDIPKFDQWQEHHVFDKSTDKEYDFSVFNIIKYFRLVMDNNPNMIDSLFVPRRCIMYSTQIGEHIRENRDIFLHKGCWHKFKGYAFSQLKKMNTKTPKMGSKRRESWEEHGYDLKFAYHIVRLLNEVEQMMTEHTLDLQRNREQLKSIRRGEWTKERIIEYFETKEKTLEDVYSKCELPYGPRKDEIKIVLMNCLEMWYGSLDKLLKADRTEAEKILAEIRRLVG